VAKLLMLCLFGLFAGACFVPFSRALALAIGMASFGLVLTPLVALSQGWTIGEAALGFISVIVAFQCGYMIVAGLSFMLASPMAWKSASSAIRLGNRTCGERFATSAREKNRDGA